MPHKSSILPKDVDERERSDEEDSQQPYDDETVAEASHPSPKESDSDSDTEGSPGDYVVQPIAKVPPSSWKRSRPETGASKSGKKLKKCGGGVWSEEDEMATLEGMVEFKASKGVDPSADMWAFHSFIKGKLKADFSKDQLRRKIGRMKKRFINVAAKPVFSKPHQVMAFEISQKIWGNVEMIEGDEKKNEEKDESENGEKGDFWGNHVYIADFLDNIKLNFPTLSCGLGGMRILREKLSSIGKVKAKEMDDKCKQLAIERIELDYKMLELMNEQLLFSFDR